MNRSELGEAVVEKMLVIAWAVAERMLVTAWGVAEMTDLEKDHLNNSLNKPVGRLEHNQSEKLIDLVSSNSAKVLERLTDKLLSALGHKVLRVEVLGLSLQDLAGEPTSWMIESRQAELAVDFVEPAGVVAQVYKRAEELTLANRLSQGCL